MPTVRLGTMLWKIFAHPPPFVVAVVVLIAHNPGWPRQIAHGPLTLQKVRARRLGDDAQCV